MKDVNIRIPEEVFVFISLYEASIYYLFTFLTIASGNIYIVFLFLFILLKVFPMRFIQRLTTTTVKEYTKRPEGAMNCSLLSSGGSYESIRGFPSGQSMISSFLFFYTVLEFARIKKETGKSIGGILAITTIFFILVPLTRFHIRCNTVSQISAGMVMGLMWAGLFYAFEQAFLLSWDEYKRDKDTIVRFLTEDY